MVGGGESNIFSSFLSSIYFSFFFRFLPCVGAGFSLCGIRFLFIWVTKGILSIENVDSWLWWSDCGGGGDKATTVTGNCGGEGGGRLWLMDFWGACS